MPSSKKIDSKVQLEESIKNTIDFVNETKINAQSKVKKRKKRKSRKQYKKEHILDEVVDEMLQLKEGERKAQLIRPIIPIREWLGNEYYCGSEIFNLYPFWKKHLIAIYESPVLINEIILGGGLRHW